MIGGTVNLPSSPAIDLVYNTRTTISDLGDGVRRFWELEEPPQVSRFTSEEQQAIDHFNSTHSRDSDGRYFQGKYQLSNLAVPEIRLSDVFYRLKEFPNAKVPGTSSG